LAKNSPSAFGFFDFRDVSEDIAGELRLDPEADVDEGRDTERVFMVRGGGSLRGVVRLRDLDSEEAAFDEGCEVDGTTAETVLVK
jgi:hypothetical protein